MKLSSTAALSMSACTKRRARQISTKKTASYNSKRKRVVLKALKLALSEHWGCGEIFEFLVREVEKIKSPVIKKVPGTEETLDLFHALMRQELTLAEAEDRLNEVLASIEANPDTEKVGREALTAIESLKAGESFSTVYSNFVARAVDIEIVLYSELMERCITRYISSEDRLLEPVEDGAEVNLSEDLIDANLDSRDTYVYRGEETIEIIKFKASKPWYTMNGEKNNVESSLELYALYCYGKSLVQPGENKTVKASYYYLQKRTDSRNADNPRFDPDFFTDDESNVVWIENDVDKRVNPEGEPTYLDDVFIPQIEAFYEGKSEEDASTSGDCENCSLKEACMYKHAPKHIIKERKAKSLSDICLTDAQEKAVEFTKGLLRINAGAGAGKTLIVALRVVNLLQQGVKPEEICLLTFTNTGAAEFRERISLYNSDFGTGADISKLISTTFNGFANQIVLDNFAWFNFTDEPRLIDEIEKSSIIARLIKANYIKGLNYNNFLMNSKYTKGALPLTIAIFDIIKKYSLGAGDEEEVINRVKQAGLYRFASTVDMTKMLDLYSEYSEILNTENLIEYADQEILMFDFLNANPDYLENMGIKHVIVDEFQDSDAKQIELLKMLRDCPSWESVMVVGDDSQAIFSFRDTSPEYIIRFFDIMGEEGEDIFLVENHRSVSTVIDLANKINALNLDRIEKDLIATRTGGKEPVVQGFYNKKSEYDWICDQIKEQIDSGKRPEDIAVIVSDKFEIQDIMSELTLRDIPCVSLNPVVMLENSRVIAAIALAKVFDNIADENSALVYLNALTENKLLEKTDDEIETLIVGLGEEVKKIISEPEPVRLSEFRKLLEILDAENTDEVYTAFLEKIKYRKNFKDTIKYMLAFELYGGKVTHKLEQSYPGVVVTTAWSAKGMEWPTVFVSVSKFHKKEMGQQKLESKRPKFEEKRRLLFVAITRAMDELYISGQYVAYGPKGDRTYNCFLREVYDSLGKTQEYCPVNMAEEAEEAERKEAARKSAANRRKAEKEKKIAEISKKASNVTDFDAKANALAAALREIG